MKSKPKDERVLLSLLPEVVWRQVLECMEPRVLLLEECSKAIPFFHQMLEKRGRVLVYTKKPTILPRCIREKMKRKDRVGDYWKLFDTLNMQSPRLTTLHIFLKSSLYFETKLNEFLERHCDTLEIVSISLKDVDYSKPPVLKLPEMRNLRIFKLIRWVGSRSHTKLTSFIVDHPVYDVFPALESLSLSLGGDDQWPDFLRCSEQNQNQVCPTVRRLRLLDYVFAFRKAFVTLESALKLFPNLVSVEIPARRGAEVVFQAKSLKCLTLTKVYWASGKHTFDMFLTGYSRKTCAAILRKLEPQKENWGTIEAERENRVNNITNLQALEILRIKCEIWESAGPTLVTLTDLAKLKSLRIWEICGHKPEYIPDDLLTGKATAGFKISWKE